MHHNTIVRLEDGDEGVQGRTLKQVADALIQGQGALVGLPHRLVLRTRQRKVALTFDAGRFTPGVTRGPVSLLSFDQDRLHLFDAVTERALTI